MAGDLVGLLVDEDGRPPCAVPDDCDVCRLLSEPGAGETWPQWYARVSGQRPVPVPEPKAVPERASRGGEAAAMVGVERVRAALDALRAEERAIKLRLVEVRGGIQALDALLAASPEAAPASASPTPDGEPLKFGTLLQAYRKAAGITQTALAKAAGIDPAHVNKIEKHSRAPSRDLARRLAVSLRLGDEQADRLLLAAGYAPLAMVGRSA